MRRRAAPSLFGRAEELALLGESLRRAERGTQQLVLLEGDAGIGKTALLREFARRAARRGRRAPRFLYLAAPPVGAYLPVRHAALAATSRRLYARLEGGQATELARGVVLDWMAAIPIWGPLLAALGATARLAARRRSRTTAGPATGDEDVDALLRAARRRPLVLLLDDLERADRAAVARIETLVATVDDAPLLVVGAYRPTAPGAPDPPVHGLRRRLPLQGELFTHRRLVGLDPPDLAAWVEHGTSGGPPPTDRLRALQEETGGHPGLVAAALRRPGSEAPPPPPAPNVDLGALDPAVAQILVAAARLGVEFDGEAVARLLGRDALAVEDALALAAHFGVVAHAGERLLDGEVTTVYRFASPHHAAALRAQAAAPPTAT